MNTDRKDTGWYGYDFIVNHKAKDEFTATVAKYNGTDGAYDFETAGEVSYRVKGQEMMISVPLEILNVEGYKEINVEFKVADSRTVYYAMEDFYCDGDADPLGRMNYVYQNYIPGVSEITYPEQETDSVTETEDGDEQTAVDATGEEETSDTNSDKKGCRSAVCGAWLLPLIASAAALIVWKKKDIPEFLSREA